MNGSRKMLINPNQTISDAGSVQKNWRQSTHKLYEQYTSFCITNREQFVFCRARVVWRRRSYHRQNKFRSIKSSNVTRHGKGFFAYVTVFYHRFELFFHHRDTIPVRWEVKTSIFKQSEISSPCRRESLNTLLHKLTW